ncbi:pyocin knob domain-containing protein [Paenibacillus sinopodophylli]|uniref:pyocin knob domain-containing protein n=1 Tax=Paenibacillus sinopodophylli TaxID=1837342 RepID=UPI00110CDF06|nr:pyocin knob domain-containing protein [Paenibacillus sinopodophylli]
MQTTGNLGLRKPEGTDVVDIADFNGNADIIDTAIAGKVDKEAGKGLSANDFTSAEKTKLAGVSAGANTYVHPSTHPASIIVQDASSRFVTDTEKATWNAKASTAAATTTTAGLQSAADKTKLDGIATGANNYTHPSSHAASMITIADAGSVIAGTNVETALQEIAGRVKTQQKTDGMNVNTLTATGRYTVYNGINAPMQGGVIYYDVIDSFDGSPYCTQVARWYADNRIWSRVNINGTWTSWTHISNETVLLANGTSLDTLTTPGNYSIYSATGTLPFGSSANITIQVVPFDNSTTYLAQTVIDFVSNRRWARNRVNGNWTNWIQYGNEAFYLANTLDLNTITITGNYVSEGNTNRPTGSSFGHLMVSRFEENPVWITQTYRDFYNTRTWERRCINGIWSAWGELHTTTITPSDTVIMTANTERSGAGSTLKSFNVKYGGRYRIKGEMRVATAGNTGGILAWINAAATNPIFMGSMLSQANALPNNSPLTTSASYVVFSVDFEVAIPPNSSISIAAIQNNVQTFIRNVTICGSESYVNNGVNTIVNN